MARRKKLKPVAVTAAKPLFNEIATAAKDTTVVTFGGPLTTQDETLLSRGGGEGLKIYDRIERDCHAFAVMQKRKKAIIARPWIVEPASEAAGDQKTADLVRDCLEHLDFDKASEDLLDAVLKGFAVGEVMWEETDGVIRPAEIRPRDPRRFTFLPTDDGYELRLLTQANPVTGEPVPDRKFIVHTVGSKTGNPFGLGLGTLLFWPVFFKRKGITFWLTFCDKYGSPTAKGTYPVGTPKPDQAKLLEALQAIAQDSGIIVPEGMVIELLEAAKSGIDTYEKLVRYMDEQISEAVLGETGSTNQSGDGGSRARDQVGNECRLEIARADADLLSGTLNRTLVRWIVEINAGGARPPQVWRDFEEPEDLVARANRDKTLADIRQFKFSRKYWLETYGFEEDDIEDMPPPPPALEGQGGLVDADRPGKPLAFAEPGVASPLVDRNLVLLEREAGQETDRMIEEFRKLIERSSSLQEAQARLLDLFGNLDPTRLGVIMQRALVATDLGGRAEVLDGQ